MTETRAVTPKFAAAVAHIGRTGSSSFEIRYCGGGDDAEQPPIAWIALAVYPDGRFECAAASNPERAVIRLCAQLLDGGTCTHCKRMVGFDDDHDDTLNGALTGAHVCWYMWDPERSTFRRGCEGSDR